MDVSRARFEALVGEALDTIPEELARLIDNCVVVVEEWPSDDQLRDSETPPGETLFGIYEGIDLTSRSPLDYAGVLPDRIVVFMGPHLEVAESEADLAEEIRVTVVHEIAHHFGIDDDRLHELGWG
ncbi:MAG TPA: metallopeptidase family protein [Acidimicrobiia bacterium]|nr:metallopeptidase family protein [Acidimicrobiia bacterium]